MPNTTGWKPALPGADLRSHSYGDAAGAGEVAGVPKVNCTGGGRSAPVGAVKNGLGAKPSMPATKLVGKLRTATLSFCTALLQLQRPTQIRFSVPYSCACKLRTF